MNLKMACKTLKLI